jgi:hypothetical protein
MKKMTALLFCVMSIAGYQSGYAEQEPPKPADVAQKDWNRPEGPENLYRAIRLRYVGPRLSDEGRPLGEVPIINLTPEFYSLSDPMTAQECTEGIREIILHLINANPDVIAYGKRVWVDPEEGVLGSETASEYYFFRYVCLPMSTVDDLDMFGTHYRQFYIQDPPGKQRDQTKRIHYLREDLMYLVSQDKERTKERNEHTTQNHKKDVANGYATIVQSDDVRIHFWYDPVRFFRRFEKYGISATLKIPDTKKGEETWEDSSWNTMFKVLPLGKARTLDTSGETPGANDEELARQIYKNLNYQPKIPLYFNP